MQFEDVKKFLNIHAKVFTQIFLNYSTLLQVQAVFAGVLSGYDHFP